MKTLVIVAHRDDEVLSAGGLIRTRVMEHGGDNVGVGVVYGRKYPGKTPEEQAELDEEQDLAFTCARQQLGYKHSFCSDMEEGEPGRTGYYATLEVVEGLIKAFQPYEVVIPGADDLNQDHRHLHEICRIALRPGNRGSVKRVLEAMAHDVLSLQPATYAVELSYERVRIVREAMLNYETEVRQPPHPRSLDNIEARYRVYGAQFGVAFAEPYRMVAGIE